MLCARSSLTNVLNVNADSSSSNGTLFLSVSVQHTHSTALEGHWLWSRREREIHSRTVAFQVNLQHRPHQKFFCFFAFSVSSAQYCYDHCIGITAVFLSFLFCCFLFLASTRKSSRIPGLSCCCCYRLRMQVRLRQRLHPSNQANSVTDHRKREKEKESVNVLQRTLAAAAASTSASAASGRLASNQAERE